MYRGIKKFSRCIAGIWTPETKIRNASSGGTVTVLSHIVRSLPRHLDDIVSDNRIINNNITEAQIKPSNSISDNSNFINNEKF